MKTQKNMIDITELNPIEAMEKAFKASFGGNPYSIDTDEYGQIIIYTGLKENDDGSIREMVDEDFENVEDDE
jgi:hypothetical protein